MNIIIHSNNEKIYKRTSITILHTFNIMNEYYRKEEWGGGINLKGKVKGKMKAQKTFPNY